MSQLGLTFFADRNGGLGEMLPVLAPGGRMAVAVWDSLEQSPAYAIEVELLERVGGTRAADAFHASFAPGRQVSDDGTVVFDVAVHIVTGA